MIKLVEDGDISSIDHGRRDKTHFGEYSHDGDTYYHVAQSLIMIASRNHLKRLIEVLTRLCFFFEHALIEVSPSNPETVLYVHFKLDYTMQYATKI